MRAAVAILAVLFFSCSNDHPPTTREADNGVIDAGSAVDAGQAMGEELQEIYAVGECPERLLPPDLEPRPTTACFQGQCRQERPCRRSADCTARPHGRCAGHERSSPDGGFIEFVRCEYHGCGSDADCEQGKTCACGLGGLRLCVAAGCRVDADCAGGGQCVRGDACGWGPYGDFVCTSDADECRSNEDCHPNGNSCTVGEQGHLVCIDIICD